MLVWARERADREVDDFPATFNKLAEWESGAIQPTLKQAEAFANAVHVPVGYLFLSNPPEEAIPIPDFRTFPGQAVARPSPNLLDTIYACQQRQSWYREFARVNALPELDFVGSASLRSQVETVAADIRDRLGFDLVVRRECPTWTDARRLFIQQADNAGILVMVSGVVMSNGHRRLDPREFRGFAMSDPLAPLVFINGRDTKAAQIFTLAHELAHIWLGASALSNLGAALSAGDRREEAWCNAVAAEFLVPLADLQSELRPEEPLADSMPRLARVFKVSSLVILRRLLDAERIDRGRFDAAWQHELERLRVRGERDAGGGDFYRTTLARVGRRFAQALVVSTLEGQTLYRDSFRLLGIRKTATFNRLGLEMGLTT